MRHSLLGLTWEITMGCNLRCRHCGSACSEPGPEELSTQEALEAVRQIAALNPQWVVLTGGEPLLRRDWPILAKALTEQGQTVSMVTNGTLITREVVRHLKESGVRMASVSIDGCRETHNQNRGRNCYDQCLAALAYMRQEGMALGVNTTVMQENLQELDRLKADLLSVGVQEWQLQAGLPSGTLKFHPESILLPSQIEGLIDYVYRLNAAQELHVYLAESVGYYTKKECLAHQMASNSPNLTVWDGCNAGIRHLALWANGDITGCVTLRHPAFTEANIRNTSLISVWEDDAAFQWRRALKKEQLGPLCSSCQYAEKCLGGCTNTRLTLNGTIYSNNPYCVYGLSREKT